MSRTFSRDDTRRLAVVLAEVAQSVVMPRFRNLPPEAIRSKGSPHNLVTDADEEAERQMRAAENARRQANADSAHRMAETFYACLAHDAHNKSSQNIPLKSSYSALKAAAAAAFASPAVPPSATKGSSAGTSSIATHNTR